MIKRTAFSLLIFFSLAINLVIAQTSYFNNTYSFNNMRGSAKNCIKTQNGYIILGNTFDTIYGYWLRLGMTKIDESGNQLWSKDYGDTVTDTGMGFSGAVLRNSDTTFLITGSRMWYYTEPYADGFLMCCNDKGDSLWFKELRPDYLPPLDTQITTIYISKCHNNNYVLTGQFGVNAGTSKILLTKLDSIGNFQFLHGNYFYGASYQNVGYSVEPVSDGGFIIGGYSILWGLNYSGDPILVKTDSVGNQQWILNLGGNFRDYMALITNTTDSCVVVGTAISTSPISYDDYYRRVKFFKVDLSGNIIWEKFIGPVMFNCRFNCIKQTADGGYLACGSFQQNNSVRFKGWVSKIDHNGDSIWFREFQNLTGYESINELYDIIECTDGGFLACGSVDPSPPDPGIRSAWVIKLDSIGCPYHDCDSTSGLPVVSLKISRTLSIWPNPANDLISVEWFSPTQVPVTSLEIYSSQGAKVMEINTPSQKLQHNINIQTLTPGMYLVVAKNEKNILALAKFIIIR